MANNELINIAYNALTTMRIDISTLYVERFYP